ncbi:hypothetical protein BDZ90DRAFT_217977 [Jaminaea rosea]|uniref:VWFA domain-containing protein n=1 Tax=Jaminaea rosea TaxID=1569628 RepID=A0A316UUG7_9BASI|nr:hypothetical protein BDZ90DRAFT_217977 [Jaminaea rosea]PWN28950.1 hypothetical protein BDZ90DRAFT_217977 [Jaminaea rosea]
MTFKKKLLIAGLVGTTCLALYKLSKSREKEKEKLRIEQAAQHHTTSPMPPTQAQQQQPGQQGHNYAAWAAGGAGAAAVAAAGAYAYQHHHQQAPAPLVPEESGDILWSDLRDWRLIARLLAATVADQNLYPFYDWAACERIARQLASSGTLVSLGESWEMPPFLAQDLVKLALFDVMFLLDDSASMNSEKGLRIEALRQIMKRSADAAGRLDPDGMECAWMNAPGGHRIHSASEAESLVKACQFSGPATPLGEALEQKLIRPLLLNPLSSGQGLKKPVLAIIITDGRPTGPTESGERIVKVIQDAKSRLKKTQYGEDALSITIAAVGNDSEAQDWLDSIDNHPAIGDLVDVVSDIRVEAKQVKAQTGVDLTPDLHCLKLLLGAVDSGYDASDEPPGAAKKSMRRENEREAKAKHFAKDKERLIAQRDAAMAQAGVAPGREPAAGSVPASQMSGAGYPPATGAPYPPQQQHQQGGYPPATGGYPGGGYPPANNSPYPPQGGVGAPYPPQASAYGAPPEQSYYGGAAPPPYSDHSRGFGGGAQSSYPQQQPHQGGAPGVGGFAMPQPNASPYPGGPGQQPPSSSYPGQGQQPYPPPGGPMGFPSAFGS